MGERLRRGLKPRNKRETGAEPLKGKNPGERPELSKTRGRSEDNQQACRQLQCAKRNLRETAKPIQKDIVPIQRDNRRTGSRVMQVVMYPYHLSGKNHGESQDLPKTRCLSENHQERTRQQLQGTKRSFRWRLEPHPEGSRAKHQGKL